MVGGCGTLSRGRTYTRCGEAVASAEEVVFMSEEEDAEGRDGRRASRTLSMLVFGSSLPDCARSCLALVDCQRSARTRCRGVLTLCAPMRRGCEGGSLVVLG